MDAFPLIKLLVIRFMASDRSSTENPSSILLISRLIELGPLYVPAMSTLSSESTAEWNISNSMVYMYKKQTSQWICSDVSVL